MTYQNNYGRAGRTAHASEARVTGWTGGTVPATEIKEKITEATVKFAERFGEYLARDDSSNGGSRAMTSSQLRRFYGEVKRQQVKYDMSDFVLLKPKLAYAVGRDKGTKIVDFYKVMTEAMSQVSNEQEFGRFVKVFEAIVAFHKANSKEK